MPLNQGLARRVLPILFPAIVLCSCVGCDQWTKSLATEHLKQAPAMSFLGDTLRIQYAENPGAFLGAGSQLSPTARFAILVVVNAVFLGLIAALVFAKRVSGRMQHLAVVLLLAGGIGNLIDRVFHDGLVIDFLNVGIGPLRTGIFNVADMAIMTGFGILILYRSPNPGPSDSPVAAFQTGNSLPQNHS
jgi:signal peptidase II